MATMVSFHAHPDDESIACGGVMRKAFEEGHRVVLVVATRGEQGEVVDGVLADGEPLWQRRVAETHAAAEVLGVHARSSSAMSTPG
ncbi:GlcNAc-PI de-N-acetylase [Halopolyspora algeriensis]|uniref:GlcNAc-PI de-N-acetylase n=1 Tax=Halopolyspora algeriensis TaxID=1500506 RepID=A0A368VIT0_9ACTN|nr:GlcNAc-PI de-N-acetylase [Halopolyspora algeriensis]